MPFTIPWILLYRKITLTKTISCSLLSISTFVLLSGCGLSNQPAQLQASAGVALSGVLHGGQQPVAGASVKLMIPGSTGYGSAPGILATTSTLADGSFRLPPYTCPANSGNVYLLATGGDAGAGPNAALAEAALLGPCSGLSASTVIGVSEVTTVVAAYALAPFANVTPTVTGIGTSPTNLQGLINAYGPADNLVDNTNGFARAPGALPGLVLPQAELNTIANILATCVNSNGSSASSTPCGRLFAATTPSGGAAPVDTFQAALNLASSPAMNTATLYNLSSAASPFQPSLTSSPSDFAVAIQYTGGSFPGSYGTEGIAIDPAGNAWISTGEGAENLGKTHTLTEISPSGVFLSGTAGFGSTTLSSPEGLAILADSSVFVADVYSNKVYRFSSNGNLMTASSAASLAAPYGLSLDTDSSVWVTNAGRAQISHLTTAGADKTGSPYTIPQVAQSIVLNAAGNWSSSFGAGGGANGYVLHYSDASPSLGEIAFGQTGQLTDIALDHSGNAWFSLSSSANGSVGRLSQSSNSNLTPIPVASPLIPQSLVIDGLGNVWVNTYNRTAQSTASVLLEYSNSGTLISPVGGYSALGTLPSSPSGPKSLALDGSGNLWMTGQVTDNSGNPQANAVVTEIIGIVAPVVTPSVTAATNGTLGARP